MDELEQTVESTQDSGQVSAPEAPQQAEPNTIEHLKETLAGKNESEKPSQTPPAQAFTPNYKYKAYEKEYEIPEQFRALIKDEATNAEVRKIFEKATGFDGLMPKYQRSKTTVDGISKEYTTFKQEVAPVIDVYNKATKFLTNKDYDSLFETLGIGDEDLQKWMLRKVTLTEQQKDAYNREREAIRRQYELEDKQAHVSQEALSYKERYEDMLVQQRTSELQAALSRPEIVEIASQFDQKYGQPGAFQKEVVQRAILHHSQTGEDLPVEQAVTNVYNMFKPFLTTVSPEAAAKKAEASVVNTVQKKNGVPVIPNVGGRTSSPVTKEITSLDELRAKIKSGSL